MLGIYIVIGIIALLRLAMRNKRYFVLSLAFGEAYQWFWLPSFGLQAGQTHEQTVYTIQWLFIRLHARL